MYFENLCVSEKMFDPSDFDAKGWNGKNSGVAHNECPQKKSKHFVNATHKF